MKKKKKKLKLRILVQRSSTSNYYNIEVRILQNKGTVRT